MEHRSLGRRASLPPLQTSGHEGGGRRTSLQAQQLPRYAPNPAPSRRTSTHAQDVPQEQPRTNKRQLGEWTLGKTLGAGSMGKVKLGLSTLTGEKVAIKIIPRHTSTAAAYASRDRSSKYDASERATTPTDSFLAKAATKDASKEVRTVREAAISLLLFHPYICGMRDMITHPNHYYMVQEYVDGGQMLDYIISHGRLRERAARKFARQIGSALEYCHANSIVHRDLKIENILISNTGNIKIIDFGLSNLFSPQSHLSTFCGSLYFAAPELLNAKVYTGPEVDVWSFGIVLYVLVCGKVPFDDQSMPALHAKIKRGLVEYPTWLSAECKHLLSRMLVTTPGTRANLQEVLNHVWMTKGYTGPPNPHLSHREPLKLEDLDDKVIEGMSGFEFGTPTEIRTRLEEILSSSLYRHSVRKYNKNRDNGNASPTSDSGKYESNSSQEKVANKVKSPSKRFSTGLDFYRKKIASGVSSVLSPNHHSSSSSPASPPHYTDVQANGHFFIAANNRDLDPTRSFDPLLSIYYLVKEKRERERIYGPNIFASSTLSINGPMSPLVPQAAHASANAGVSVSGPVPADYDVPKTPRMRTRAGGEEVDAMGVPTPIEEESAQIPAVGNKRDPPTLLDPPLPRSRQVPSSAKENRKSVQLPSISLPRRPNTSAGDSPSGSREDGIPSSPSTGFARRFGNFLGRTPSTTLPSPQPPAQTTDSTSKMPEEGRRHGHTRQRSAMSGQKGPASPLLPLDASGLPLPPNHPSPDDNLPLNRDPAVLGRSSTVGGPSSSPPHAGHGHSRGVSLGGAATMGRLAGLATSERRRNGFGSTRRPKTADLSSAFNNRISEEGSRETGEQNETDSTFKPVYLKGLFSVATTSTKSPALLRENIVQVLDRLGVAHRQIKAGFECAHAPSIDLSSLQSPTTPSAVSSPRPFFDNTETTPERRRSILGRRSSKLGLTRTPFSKDKDLHLAATSNAANNGASNSSISASTAHERMPTSSSSFTILGHGPAPYPDDPNLNSALTTAAANRPVSSVPEQDTTAGSENDLVVRFEIFIVKVPWIPGLNGLQFRRIRGSAWQYSQLARRILSELNS